MYLLPILSHIHTFLCMQISPPFFYTCLAQQKADTLGDPLIRLEKRSFYQ